MQGWYQLRHILVQINNAAFLYVPHFILSDVLVISVPVKAGKPKFTWHNQRIPSLRANTYAIA